MSIERETLIAALRLTRNGPTCVEEISSQTRFPLNIVGKVLRSASVVDIVQLDKKLVTLSSEQRVKAAVRAMILGADSERVCSFLRWEEFENIAVLTLDINDYKVKKHFRFKSCGRRWEVDVLGLKEPIAISADCKHWHHGWRGAASRRAAKGQIMRTKALADESSSIGQRIGIAGWKHVYFVPLILSLIPSSSKFSNGTPIVPVLQLRDFLHEMPAYLDEITHFYVSSSPSQRLCHSPKDIATKDIK